MSTDYGYLAPDYGPANYEKGPDEAIVIEFPWAARLNGETISTVTYLLPDGLTNEAEAGTTSLRTVRVGGGNDGLYRVIGKITTSAGRRLEWIRRVLVSGDSSGALISSEDGESLVTES